MLEDMKLKGDVQCEVCPSLGIFRRVHFSPKCDGSYYLMINYNSLDNQINLNDSNLNVNLKICQISFYQINSSWNQRIENNLFCRKKRTLARISNTKKNIYMYGIYDFGLNFSSPYSIGIFTFDIKWHFAT
jgi:hypothetical protein